MDDYRIDTIKILALLYLIAVLFLVIFLALTSGCLTLAKQTAYAAIAPPATPTPPPTTAAPTATPTPNITAAPEPVYDWGACDPLQECYRMREFKSYFRENANNFGQDLRTSVTVYGYLFLPYYHYYSVSWARPLRETPPDGKQFLFVFVNMYSDSNTQATQYGFKQNHFVLQVRNNTYYPDDVWYPERRIVQLEEVWDYGHIESVKPYGYRIVQEKGTGIISAEELFMIYPGRSNAWDGWIRYTIPKEDKDPKEMRVHANLANLGGRVNWILQE